jgi:hypothetical protein
MKDSWARFRDDPAPLTKIRPLHAALQDAAGKGNCPGLNVLFTEARDHGTVMGVAVLRLGSRIYLPREPIIRKVEGR